MNILVDSRQMKLCDSNTIHHFKVPSMVLMERAACSVVQEIKKQMPAGSRVLLVCGTGNNGGDGLAAGRILRQQGYRVTLVMPGDLSKASEETARQLEICKAYGMEILKEIPKETAEVVVDALFGIGLSRVLEGTYYKIVEQMNEMDAYKIAIDIPSGIHADTGEVMGTAFRAAVTVTFGFCKLGIRLYPGAEYAGRIEVADIGITSESFLGEPFVNYELEPEDLQQLPKRKNYSNKGSYGKVLVVAGHKNMAGAAFLSAKAAYVTGAGLVKIYTEEANRQIIQQLLPEAVLETYEPKQEWRESLKDSLDWADVIVAGPGMGTDKKAEEIIKVILEYAKVPVVLDADGLNITARHKEWLQETEASVIITPHLSEMSRLVQKSIISIQKQLLQVAREFAEEYNVVCVLKDARTITALPDGRAYINTSGNNGMATAGAGDVLTGVLAGLMAQRMKPEKAASIGVYLHGSGGDCILSQTGNYGMMAQDIIEGVRQKMTEITFNKEGN